MADTVETESPALYAHASRKDWGLGVLVGVRDGKRRYLFETGVVRTMGSASHDQMCKLGALDEEQQAALTRLTALVARRDGTPSAEQPVAALLFEQLARFRRDFPGGFAEADWKHEQHAGRMRVRLAEVQQQLSSRTLDAQSKAHQLEALWASVSAVLKSTEWLSGEQLKPGPELGLGLLVGAVRELLHGSTAPLEHRVDRFVVAYETAFRRPPRWETVTALLALLSPTDHVLVDLASFRRQFKVLGVKAPLPTRPEGAAYARCRKAARLIATKLTEDGQQPRDLLDIHDFIRFTLRPVRAAKRRGSP